MLASPPPYSSGPPPAGIRCNNAQQNLGGYGSVHVHTSSRAVHEGSSLLARKTNYTFNRLSAIIFAALLAFIVTISVTYPVLGAHHRNELRRMEDWVVEERGKLDAREKAVHNEVRRMEDWVAEERSKLDTREKAVRSEEERQARDIERRLRSNIHWGSLQRDDACVGWKKMKYSAELQGLPHDVDGVAWCQETSIDIYNTVFDKPDYCEKTAIGRVIGHWTRTDEPHCNTMWGDKEDWGCQDGLPGYRRIRMRLWDHHQPWEETWFPLCETTPWPGYGTPDNCEHAGNKGIWGEWRVRDEQCG